MCGVKRVGGLTGGGKGDYRGERENGEQERAGGRHLPAALVLVY